MDIGEIKLQVSELVCAILNDKRLINAEYYDLPLTGKTIQCGDRELLYITLEIMMKYHVRLSASDVQNYRFNSISSISEIIYTKIAS